MVWLLVALGLVVLILAGDLLVRGAVNLALRLGIPALIVSLTIVAFGTSAPELLIVLRAMVDNAPGLAVGNVVGSNTANILLVLGLPAIIAAIGTKGTDTRRSYLQMIAATVLFIALAMVGPFGMIHAVILLAALAWMLFDQGRIATATNAQEEPEGADDKMPIWKVIGFLVLGIAGLPLGASLLVDNAIIIARDVGVSEAAIGLTLIAVGTSLPELATVVMAAIRKQADVALGNVIGSNMFNLLGIIGVAALFDSIPVAPEFLTFDLWIMLGASVLLAPFVFLGWTISRLWGAALTFVYLVYVVVVIT